MRVVGLVDNDPFFGQYGEESKVDSKIATRIGVLASMPDVMKLVEYTCVTCQARGFQASGIDGRTMVTVTTRDVRQATALVCVPSRGVRRCIELNERPVGFATNRLANVIKGLLGQ